MAMNREVAETLGVELEKVRSYLQERGIFRFIEGIQESGRRATGIVNDMLAFSRRSKAELAPTRVNEMLDVVIRLAGSDYDLKKNYDFRQIQIIRDYDPELDWIYCDRTEIEQVLLNLVKNAAQAMSSGVKSKSQRIVLRTRKMDDQAYIEVEDSGPGMDEETRRRVFEPFFTTKMAGVGTGLGLSVSYFIITEQHRGDIQVSSSPGQGTCFTIRLPIGASP
jgi:signal transduction histidine kinase